MKNYYNILGVSEDANTSDITKAFKGLAKKYHPDRGGDAEKFKEINEAHDTLKNSNKRTEYDTIRKYGSSGSGGNFHFQSGNVNDMFNEFFSGSFGGGEDMDFGGRFNFGGPKQRRPRTNQSIKIGVTVSIKEVVNKIERTLSVNLPSGKQEIVNVTIPAGCQNGINFRYRGMGDNSDPNLPRGDLIVVVTVLDSDGFTRQGNDLHTVKTIDCFQAIRGCEFKLKCLDDNVINVKVPPATQPGTILSITGRGMPVHDALNIRGNIYVKIHVVIPQLSETELKKIKNL